MNLEGFDESRCELAEKQIIEGLCLSFDLLRQICLETGESCIALRNQQDFAAESAAPQAGTTA